MLTPDIVELREFYATNFGRNACALIRERLLRCWPSAKGETLIGIGYVAPYLKPYLEEASAVAACMPAKQGAAYWPANRANLAFLSHESELPLRENSINRVLLVHSLETSDQLSWMLREVWRVLTPGGRVMVIVPNRMGLWARSSRSPFGYGLPFSMMQLRSLVTSHDFTVMRTDSALFIPPTRSKMLWRIAGRIERAGHLLCAFFGGVLLVEAEKQVYAAVRQPVTTRSYRAVPAVKPVMSKEV